MGCGGWPCRICRAAAAISQDQTCGRWPSVRRRGAPGSGSELDRGQRFALFSAVRERLARTAEPDGLLLALDDIQWADEPSLLLLDHVGAKTGKRRTTPLVYMPDGDDFVVVASKGGFPDNPGWLYNLRAHADTEVQIGRRRIRVHATEATDDERRRIWPRAIEHNPHWDRYQQRTDRRIPVVILRPAG